MRKRADKSFGMRLGAGLGGMAGLLAASMLNRRIAHLLGLDIPSRVGDIGEQTIETLRRRRILPKEVPLYFAGRKLEASSFYIPPGQLDQARAIYPGLDRMLSRKPEMAEAARRYGVIVSSVSPDVGELLRAYARARGYTGGGSYFWARIRDAFDVPMVVATREPGSVLWNALTSGFEVLGSKRYLRKKVEQILNDPEAMRALRRSGVEPARLMEVDERLDPHQRLALLDAALLLAGMLGGAYVGYRLS